jgi:hypothetical protein
VVRGKDGKYHIPEELKVATKNQTELLVKMVEPLLNLKQELSKLLYHDCYSGHLTIRVLVCTTKLYRSLKGLYNEN